MLHFTELLNGQSESCECAVQLLLNVPLHYRLISGVNIYSGLLFFLWLFCKCQDVSIQVKPATLVIIQFNTHF